MIHSNYCLNCNKILNSHRRKFCNNQCQNIHQYNCYIDNWKKGLKSGLRGKDALNLSAHVIRYVRNKYGYCCSLCKWRGVNPYTQTCYLEIYHIDGNFLNSAENNLILLCPNCHSLTKTYKNLNKGHGRLWRRRKYVKIGTVPP